MARVKSNSEPNGSTNENIENAEAKEPRKAKKYVETPLMKQYYKIKEVHPDAVLLFRVGDFYETFGEDAIRASEILGITLTRRANGAASYVELAGFPFHSIDTYLPKLVRAGARVAICEQLEDPKTTKGLVKRGVVELVTPGVVLDEHSLTKGENRYLAAVYFGRRNTGIALLDISTGEFYCGEGRDEYINKLISNFSPKEILYQRGNELRFTNTFGDKHYTYKLDEWLFSFDSCSEKLCTQFGTRSLKGFGVESMQSAVSAAGAILSYLEFTEHKLNVHINKISVVDEGDYVWIDRFTIRNLELFNSTGGDGARTSFANVIDRTHSPMGARMLKRWIALPLRDTERLGKRLDVVEALALDRDMAATLAENISEIADIERISARIAAQRVTPREMVLIRRSLDKLETIKALMQGSQNGELRQIADGINPLTELRDRLATHIFPDAGGSISKGDVIGPNVSAELDDLRRIAARGRDVLTRINEQEIQRTGISSLKIGFNSVFGYYYEVRNAYKDRVPEDWRRIQTLTSAERYTTPELKDYEEKITGAEFRIIEIETKIFNSLIEEATKSLVELQQNAHTVARLDVLQSFARMACERRYTRPRLTTDDRIEIVQGRHPVIETLLPIGEKYVPNDVTLDNKEQQIMMITGPNMSGKSALLRQTALIVLMAQIGSFVPASSAEIGIVDKIFTRVGASDNISQGESTFMVEMLESASILNNISDRSLVLLDEIGRGTSTYDGISIAWAMVEYLHNHPKACAKTLFATHYHELGEMESSCKRVKNYHVSVKESDNTVFFIRKLERGCAERSFGIHVARMAGMPKSVVRRADEILHTLEKEHRGGNDNISNVVADVATKSNNKVDGIQLSMFQLEDPVLIEIRNQIRDLDPNDITPLEALNKLAQIKRLTGL